MTSNQVKVSQHASLPVKGLPSKMCENCVLQTHRQGVMTSLAKLLHSQGIFTNIFWIPPLHIHTAWWLRLGSTVPLNHHNCMHSVFCNDWAWKSCSCNNLIFQTNSMLWWHYMGVFPGPQDIRTSFMILILPISHATIHIDRNVNKN